jgi:hypothetical protein
MALAEVGYPDADVTGSEDDPAVWLAHENRGADGTVPHSVGWQAFRIAGAPDLPCLACWCDGYAESGDCQAVGRGIVDCDPSTD